MHPPSARWLALLLAIAVSAGAAAWQLSAPTHNTAIHVLWIASPPPSPAPRAAYISGAVVHAGVYPLPTGSRLVDLIAAAGGLNAEADSRAINLARHVGDGEHVDIPVLVVVNGRGKVPLNHASRAELLTLPGMTSQAVAAIQESVKRSGPFSSSDDLAARNVISAELVQHIAPLLDWAP